MSDSFHFDITGASLEDSLAIAFSIHKTTIGWSFRMIDNEFTLILYWTESEREINRFPVALSAKEIQPMIEKWLKEAPYGDQPDHDGDNEKGWRVFNENWGRVNQEQGAFVGIQPCWLMYGK